MSLLFPLRERSTTLTQAGVSLRSRMTGRLAPSRAMKISTVWAAVRLRADLISSFPVDVMKKSRTSSIAQVMPTPDVLKTPWEYAPGHVMSIASWIYATQTDLDRHGNAIGIILERDGNNLPRKIQPVAADAVIVKHKHGTITAYLLDGIEYTPDQIWHERQYEVPGIPLGLSPIAHAAFTLSAHAYAEDFALDWFNSGATPSALLRNEARIVPPEEGEKVKQRFLANTQNGDPVVVGKDWTYTAISSTAKTAQFLEQIRASDVEIARFMGVPALEVDAAMPGSTLTYANVTQQNLQLLIKSIGPATKRREDAFSRLTLADRFVKLNTDALLRMDPQTRATILMAKKAARVLTATEIRALDNLPPFTPEQLDEIAADAALTVSQPTPSP